MIIYSSGFSWFQNIEHNTNNYPSTDQYIRNNLQGRKGSLGSVEHWYRTKTVSQATCDWSIVWSQLVCGGSWSTRLSTLQNTEVHHHSLTRQTTGRACSHAGPCVPAVASADMCDGEGDGDCNGEGEDEESEGESIPISYNN